MDKSLRILGVVPWSIILLAVGFAAAYILYNKTTIGLNIRAIGGNKEVAKALGINILTTLMWVGVICGVFIGFASIVQESVAGRTTVKTGLTAFYVVFQPLAIVLLAQDTSKKRINIILRCLSVRLLFMLFSIC
jgi:ribose transport system permease protein